MFIQESLRSGETGTPNAKVYAREVLKAALVLEELAELLHDGPDCAEESEGNSACFEKAQEIIDFLLKE